MRRRRARVRVPEREGGRMRDLQLEPPCDDRRGDALDELLEVLAEIALAATKRDIVEGEMRVAS
jgi:hypothetical protein